ncbi:hypothetical protein K493DRAFT_308378 [Basidiobolus meristosporus CBS 931.73]|uniref:Uncharacterized protein n=1 Tax=Basidiobolus meristosporus CBS 931.73 TaxID=1314790 RepID=A0A1Y1X399_9FUNG|nr:hypothetical protein K493DRAFT_308378 [Basidiobolus meristosporus CBS 931.73]|eukprot:ORX80281.1 hypothetical protein K493DRAFT_308378 [Basidiobolus meristosporus CBS 931.73]
MVPHRANEEEFYAQVREGILVFLLFLGTLVSAFRIIGRFQLKHRDTYDEESSEALVPRLLCSCGLTFAALAFLFIPTAVIMLYALPVISSNYYLNWLDASLLTSIARYTFFGTILSLFGLIPLAYFYTETDLFKGIFGKLHEAFSVFLLVSVLTYILVFIMRGIFGLEHKPHFVILHWWICSTVAVVSCRAIPLGVMRIFEWVQTIPLNSKEHEEANERLGYLERDRIVLHQKVEFHQSRLRKHMFDDLKAIEFSNSRMLVNNTTRSIFTVLQGLKSEIHYTEKVHHEIQQRARRSPIQRSLGFVVSVVVSIISWLLFICTVSMSLFKGLFSISGKLFTLDQYRILSGLTKFEDILNWKLVETGSEFILIVYFILALVAGCYQLEPLRKMYPSRGNTSMKNIIANVTLMLIIGAALPTIVPILGLTKLDLIELYPVTDYTIQNQFWLPFVYRILIATSSSYIVLDRYLLSNLST